MNPLAYWTPDMIQDAFKRFKLPQHPLFGEGFASIGCQPCTRRVEAGEDARAGRWAGNGQDRVRHPSWTFRSRVTRERPVTPITARYPQRSRRPRAPPL